MKSNYTNISVQELEEYAQKAGLSDTIPVDLEQFQKIISPHTHKLLEVGCGTGRLGVHLIQHYAYIGIDTHDSYLNAFREKLKQEKIDFKNDQIILKAFHEYEGKDFDVVLFPWTIFWEFSKDDQRRALARARGMLAMDGTIILDNPARGSEHNSVRAFTPAEFYYDDWQVEFERLGFTYSRQCLYKTTTNREREIVILTA